MWLLALVAAVVDRIVVVVEDQPVLESEVRLEEALEAVDPSPVPFWRAVGASPLERLIDAAIVRVDARDVAIYVPTKGEVAERADALRATFPDHVLFASFLAANGLDEDQLRAVLKRRMLVERFLLRNVQAPPDDPERWVAQCTELLDGLRKNMRIREIPPREEPPE